MKTFFSSLNLQIFLFSLVAFTIPLKYNYNSISIILLAVFNLGYFCYNRENVKLHFKEGKPLIVFYCIVLLAMLYTQNLNEGFRYLQKLLPFLIFPFVFSVTEFNEKHKSKFLWAFCISCLIISVFLFVTNLFAYYDENNNIDVWYYSGFTKRMDIHPAYYILFLIFNVFFLFEELLKTISKKKKFLYSFFILIFSVQILFLQSRVGIISFLIVSFVYFFIAHKTNKKLTLIVLISAIVFLTVAYQLDFLKRFMEVPESINERILIWNGWWNSYKENPILGYGTGDAQDALDYGNYLLGNDFFIYYKYNTHNQYLDILLRYGLIGFIAFAFVFYKFIMNMIKSSSKLMLVFVVLICFFFLTENILQRQRGIVFFSFFYMFLNNSNSNEE